MASITGTAWDNNNRFNLDKLLAMDPLELSKLNDLYPEYLRYHGPKFTREIWNQCLETFFLKAHLFDKEKSNGKIFGWLNIVILNEFRRILSESKKKRVLPQVFFEDVFSSNSPTSAFNEKIPEEANTSLIDEFDFDEMIDHPNGIPHKMDELIKKYAEDDELQAIELYIRGAKVTAEEKALVIRFKNRVLRRIYRPEQLAELRKSKKHLSNSKSNIGQRSRMKTYRSDYKKMTKEERLERRLKLKAERREANIKKWKETLSPKDYQEKLRQLEYYDKVQEEHNKKNVEIQRKIREKVEAEKEKLRTELLNKNKTKDE
jgi:hypothetical protein